MYTRSKLEVRTCVFKDNKLQQSHERVIFSGVYRNCEKWSLFWEKNINYNCLKGKFSGIIGCKA